MHVYETGNSTAELWEEADRSRDPFITYVRAVTVYCTQEHNGGISSKFTFFSLLLYISTTSHFLLEMHHTIVTWTNCIFSSDDTTAIMLIQYSRRPSISNRDSDTREVVLHGGKDVSYIPTNVGMCLDMTVLIDKKRELNSSPFDSESLQLAVAVPQTQNEVIQSGFKKHLKLDKFSRQRQSFHWPPQRVIV